MLASPQLRFRLVTRLSFLSVLLLVIPAYAQDEPKKKPARKVNPAFAQITDVEGLPRVLLLGDSISIGYTLSTREALKGVANVHRPAANCGPTTRGLESIDSWLGEESWDVIHFNWGLHDLKYMGLKGENLAKPDDPGSHQQVPPAEYEANLEKLVERLKSTKAKLIWRNTTPVPEGAAGRVVGDAAKYNEIAAKVMAKHEVQIDDMFSLVKPQINEIMRPANVHFTPEGSQLLGKHVAEVIEAAIENK